MFWFGFRACISPAILSVWPGYAEWLRFILELVNVAVYASYTPLVVGNIIATNVPIGHIYFALLPDQPEIDFTL